MKKISISVLLLLQLSFSYAHVGNSNVTLEGSAGPYHVMVNIKPPDVIPGVATITVFINNLSGVKVYARPIYFNSGAKDAPSPDLLTTDNSGQFSGSIWLMDYGSASIELSVSGALGKGTILVPVDAISTTQLTLPPSTKYMLIAFGIFLLVLMITIIGLSVSDGVTKIGEAVSLRNKNSRKIAFGVTALFCSGIVFAGNKWINDAAEKNSKLLYKPMHASYRFSAKDETSQLTGKIETSRLWLTIDSVNSQRSQWLPYVIPDHGKIMHFFLISLPGMNVFAHLHPDRIDPVNFTTALPDLPAGKYLAYADIVYNSGFTETLKDTIQVQKNDLKKDTVNFNTDDALGFSNAIEADNMPIKPSEIIIGHQSLEAVKLQDGTMISMDEPKKSKHYYSNELCSLSFSVWDKNGKPMVPDLYMGMKAHAVVIRNDGNVFSHVHPVGTYSMAAQTSIANQISLQQSEYHAPDAKQFADSIDKKVAALKLMPEKARENLLMKEMNMPSGNSSNSMAGMDMSNNVSFPYTFPSAGRYRIWVEVKKNGEIYTAVFDKDVR